jgi:translation initiation factor 2B subunit (eIF-2B alpha/beta/delta family)
MSLPLTITERIEAIRRNRTSGAAEITAEAAQILLSAAVDHVPEAARLLVAAQPAMAPLVNLARTALSTSDAHEAVRDFVRRMREAAPRVAEHAARLVREGTAVLTHSYSSAVFSALRVAWDAGVRFRVTCTESRPMCEGATLAAALGQLGVPVTLIADAAVASVMPETALVLVGADAVSRSGVVNKTGTALVALAAAAHGVPMYALCGSEKILPEDYELPSEPPKDPSEILQDPAPYVSVRNYYFETTPRESFAGIVTEDGILQ